MKKLLLALPVIVSGLSFANEIKVENQIGFVRVDSVMLETVGQGFPSTEVRIRVTSSNDCEAPRAEEVVIIPSYSKDFRDLVLTVGNTSERICPQVYAPVTNTYHLGTYTKPNDGFFRRVIVNGVRGK